MAWTWTGSHRGTDGHVDLIAAFAAPGELLLQSAPAGDANADPMADNRARAEAAGLRVTEMPVLPFAEIDGRQVACPHLNLYVCTDAVIVPVAGAGSDADALSIIGAAFPGRAVEAVRATTLASRGGGPHCITQQVPARDPVAGRGQPPRGHLPAAAGATRTSPTGGWRLTLGALTMARAR